MRRTITAVLCAVGASAAFAPAALGDAKVGRAAPDVNAPGNTELTYVGDPFADDDLQVFEIAGGLSFHDSTIPIDAGHGCINLDAHSVDCSDTKLEQLTVHALLGDNTVVLEDGVTVRNVIDAGGGSDTLNGSDGTSRIDGGGGTDYLIAGANPPGLPVAQVVLGGPGADYLYGGAGPDQLQGGEGDDGLEPGAGADAIYGGEGRDEVRYHSAPAAVAVTLDSLANDGTANEHDNVGDDVEDLQGSDHPDHLVGDGGGNEIDGRDGGDEIEGNGGADTLYGKEGDDTLRSSGDGAADTNLCGAGDDDVTADPQDVLTECERVDLGGPPIDGAPVVAGGDPTMPVVPTEVPRGTAEGPAIGIAKRLVRVNRRGVARIGLSCPASAAGGCVGTLTLTMARKRLATKPFSIAAGKSARVKVRVKRLRRSRRALKVRAVVVAHADNAQSATSTRTLRLRRAS